MRSTLLVNSGSGSPTNTPGASLSWSTRSARLSAEPGLRPSIRCRQWRQCAGGTHRTRMAGQTRFTRMAKPALGDGLPRTPSNTLRACQSGLLRRNALGSPFNFRPRATNLKAMRLRVPSNQSSLLNCWHRKPSWWPRAPPYITVPGGWLSSISGLLAPAGLGQSSRGRLLEQILDHRLAIGQVCLPSATVVREIGRPPFHDLRAWCR